jgi:transcription initiation factor TFIIIB Brf1 subunit/transcription initiation factor TFIIB
MFCPKCGKNNVKWDRWQVCPDCGCVFKILNTPEEQRRGW